MFLPSCIGARETLTPMPSNTPIESETLSPTETPSPTRTFTPLHPTLTPSLTATPTPSDIHPNVVKLCPEQREIPFEELGMDSDIGMMVRIDPEGPYEGLGIISGGNPNPVISPVVPFRYVDVEISPDGQWVVFISWEMLENDIREITIWVSALDGSQQWAIAVIVDDSPYSLSLSPSWFSIDEILVLQRWGGEYETPYSLIDPFTMEQRVFSQISESAWYEGTFTVDQKIYSVFYDEYYGLENGSWESQFILLDHETNIERIIFPGNNFGDRSTSYVDHGYLWRGFAMQIDPTGKVTIVDDQSYGFNITTDLEFASIGDELNYAQIMNKVVIDDPLNWTRSMWQQNTVLGFFRSHWHTITYVDENTPFYVYDWEDNILRDYCLAGDYVSNQNYPSLNGGFTAWTVESGSYPDWEYEIFIMNLTTGYVSRFSGVEFLGWYDASEG